MYVKSRFLLFATHSAVYFLYRVVLACSPFRTFLFSPCFFFFSASWIRRAFVCLTPRLDSDTCRIKEIIRNEHLFEALLCRRPISGRPPPDRGIEGSSKLPRALGFLLHPCLGVALRGVCGRHLAVGRLSVPWKASNGKRRWGQRYM